MKGDIHLRKLEKENENQKEKYMIAVEDENKLCPDTIFYRTFKGFIDNLGYKLSEWKEEED
jgi:hypothetical protein